MLSLFQNAVQEWGLPSRVHCDYGVENNHVASYIIQHHGPGRGSTITGSSVHNSRVERTHRDVYSYKIDSSLCSFFGNPFSTLK